LNKKRQSRTANREFGIHLVAGFILTGDNENGEQPIDNKSIKPAYGKTDCD
jgi:hypothetical protein